MIHQCNTTMKNATRMQRSVRSSVSSGPGTIVVAVWGQNEALSTGVCVVLVSVI